LKGLRFEAVPCQVCNEEFTKGLLRRTRDCQGIPYRLVCPECYDKVMAKGYDGQYYDERDECLTEDY
jgi:hypothetical protein